MLSYLITIIRIKELNEIEHYIRKKINQNDTKVFFFCCFLSKRLSISGFKFQVLSLKGKRLMFKVLTLKGNVYSFQLKVKSFNFKLLTFTFNFLVLR